MVLDGGMLVRTLTRDSNLMNGLSMADSRQDRIAQLRYKSASGITPCKSLAIFRPSEPSISVPLLNDTGHEDLDLS